MRRGFRAPPYDNANFGFTNAASFYQILPNANLKPETSQRLRDRLRAASTRPARAGSSPASTTSTTTSSRRSWSAMVGPITQFQYVNLTNVTIWGVEARGEYRFAPEWCVLGWTAFAHGIDQPAPGLPVDSVDPWATQARAALRLATRAWSRSSSARCRRSTHQVSNPTYFQAPALLQSRRDRRLRLQAERVKINAGAFNITNAKYWNSAGRDRHRVDQPAARSLRPARPVLRRQPHGQMVVPAALSAERLPAPSTRAPRVSMALSLALHGLAVVLLFAAGAAGSAIDQRTGTPRRTRPRGAPAAAEADDTAAEATPSPAQPTPQPSPAAHA